jgi:transglutaminase-like putative cysteine protease
VNAAERIPFDRLLWTSGCLALALAAHLGSIPIWVPITCVIAAAVRLIAAARGRDAPPRAIRTLIAVLAVALLFLQYRTFNGIAAGTALLALVSGMKLLETRTRRDVYVVILLVYFLSVSALLAVKSFWLLAYLIGVCWLTTATLLRLSAAPPGPDWRASRRYAGRILLQALPLALVLWLFFPRFAEPLWHVDQSATSATSGIGDTMSPGDITELAFSDEIAFRVHYFGALPPREQRYWRGPVLDQFDGHTWRRGDPEFLKLPPATAQGPVYRYRLSLEPYPHPWIFALDWPTSWDLEKARLTSDYMLIAPGPVRQAVEVVAASSSKLPPAQPLSPDVRAQDTLLPPGRNPRTLEFGRQLRRAHPDDRDLVRSVLEMLHTQDYYYTLSPPPLGRDSVDEFLFATRRGFCGHYASSFAALMRAAGIPARVVTGYYGGAFNRYADYWIVRQSDAHAWDEIWIDGSGWQRVDPTAAIDPRRIDRGLQDQQAAISGVDIDLRTQLSWFEDLRLRVDALRQAWRDRVLRYNQDAQQALLARLNVPNPDAQKLVLVLAAALSGALAWLTWQVRRELKAGPRDALARSYARFCARLGGLGLPRGAAEGAEAYARRVAAARPDLAEPVLWICRRYNELRYGRASSAADLAGFAAAVRAFRPRGSRASS